jgi:cytosine/adenosine deaminase-related metal-dependent hydrolase
LRSEGKADVEIWTAGWVLPVGAPPLEAGAVGVQDGRITWVGRRDDPSRPQGATKDFGPGVLLPGLVNAHCHLELSHLAGRLPDTRDFVSWVEALIAARAADPPEVVEARATEAIAALAASGTVAVGDVSNSLVHLGALVRSPLAAAVVFYELLAWDPEKATAVLEFARARARDAGEELPSRVEIRLAAHAPHSVSPPLLRALGEDGGPASMHLAESGAEVEFLATGNGSWGGFLGRRGLGHVAFTPSGQSPVQYAESMGILHPALVAAHCVQADDADLALLARRHVAVALCPRSNLRLGVGLPRLEAMRAAGVRLCLGTDSLASADSLDLMEDVAVLRKAFPAVEPASFVTMATQGGAEALGLADLGVIAPGKRAALAYAPADRVPADPWAHVVDGGRLRRAA